MKKVLILTLLVIIAFAIKSTTPVQAESCFSDPVYDRNFHIEVITSAFVRSVACMEGSTILTTVPQGSIIKVIAETDGWYKVSLSNGTIGWVGARLMEKTDKPLSGEPSNQTTNTTTTDSRLEKYKGYIFLAVQNNGEAYYYYPKDNKGYYLSRPADAFSIMRTLGLGATHEFIHNTSYFPEHVIGRILLDVERNGEAYYIYPKNRQKYYLGRPADAFQIMRNLGLGISNTDLQDLSIVK